MADQYVELKEFVKDYSPAMAATIRRVLENDDSIPMRAILEMECAGATAITIAYLMGPLTGILVVNEQEWVDTYITEDRIRVNRGRSADAEGNHFAIFLNESLR